MAQNAASNYFSNFLQDKGIKIVDGFSEIAVKNINEEELEKQLFVISEFHKKTLGYNSHITRRLENKIGRTVEQYKINIKRVKRYLKNTKIKCPENSFEKLFLEVGDEYIEKAEKCISLLYSSGYIDIIKRSMKKSEICLGNTDFSNLRKKDNIEIISIEGCSYNTIEMDAFYLLNKYKRRELKTDYKYLTEKFCEYEDLDKNSYNFIVALLNYPYDFLRCCNRYREDKKDWSIEEYKLNLEKAIIRDSESLLSLKR